MITIIYPYRNREISRVKKSLDSLNAQLNKNFDVVFVDYGSDINNSTFLKQILSTYKFVRYFYSYHVNQPWSRSKAINIGLRFVETEYVFVADIDIIFHPNFLDLLHKLKNTNVNYYFQVGYLDKKETGLCKVFEDYNVVSKSIPEAKGLSLFCLKSLFVINGFDEFFHFWGAEDEDIHCRLTTVGFNSKLYDDQILLLHQWHPTFESLEKNKLSVEPLLSNVFELNKQKLRFNEKNAVVKANNQNWGKLISEEEFFFLNSHTDFVVLKNKKEVIDNFINIVLPNSFAEIINVVFEKDIYQDSLKYKIKKLLGMKTHDYYSLKCINDIILKTLIIYYRDCLYTYEVNSNLNSIHFKINKSNFF